MRLVATGDGAGALVAVDFPGARAHGDVRTLIGRQGEKWCGPVPVWEIEVPMDLTAPQALLEQWGQEIAGLGVPIMLLTFCASAPVGDLLVGRVRDLGAAVAAVVHVDPAVVTAEDLVAELEALVRHPTVHAERLARLASLLAVPDRGPVSVDKMLHESGLLLTEAGRLLAREAALDWEDFEGLLFRWLGWVSFLLTAHIGSGRPGDDGVPRHRLLVAGGDWGPLGPLDRVLQSTHLDVLRASSTAAALADIVGAVLPPAMLP